jgi:hypothetical protein
MRPNITPPNHALPVERHHLRTPRTLEPLHEEDDLNQRRHLRHREQSAFPDHTLNRPSQPIHMLGLDRNNRDQNTSLKPQSIRRHNRTA